jgi:hypothetical protein
MYVVYMSKRTISYDKELRISLTLTPELNQRLNKYVLEVANKRGKIPYAARTNISRAALEEWLDKHEKDYNYYDEIEETE